MSGHVSGHVPGHVPGHMPGHVSGYVSGHVSGHVSGYAQHYGDAGVCPQLCHFYLLIFLLMVQILLIKNAATVDIHQHRHSVVHIQTHV